MSLQFWASSSCLGSFLIIRLTSLLILSEKLRTLKEEQKKVKLKKLVQKNIGDKQPNVQQIGKMAKKNELKANDDVVEKTCEDNHKL